MKHLRKHLTSLAVAFLMTAALCAAVVFTGQSAAVAESAAANTVRSIPAQEAPAVDASGVPAETERVPLLSPVYILPEAPPSPSPLGVLAGALKAPEEAAKAASLQKVEIAAVSLKAESPQAASAQKTDEPSKPQDPPKPAEPSQPAEPVKPAEPALPSSDTSVIYAGVVNSSGVRLRTAPVSGSIITNLNTGTVVSIYDLKDGWYKVGYDGKTGYMSADYVTARTSASDLTGYGRTTDALNMRSGAGSGYSIVKTVSKGEYVELTGFQNGWYAVSYQGSKGYMSGDYLTPVATKPAPAPTPTPTPTPTPDPTPDPTPEPTPDPDPEPDPPPSTSLGSSIAEYAAQFVGVPYVYGGASPSGFDCSGFTMYVFRHFGYSLPHGATGQFRYGTAVSKSDLQPGDLVFFYDSDYDDGGCTATHVGIYVGGRKFLHASSYYGGITYSSIDDPYYYSPCFVGGRRLG